MAALEWRENDSLSEGQRTLKWSLYCELETFVDLEDAIAVLEALLLDAWHQRAEALEAGEHEH